MEATGEKKPAEGGLVVGDEVVIVEPWGDDLSTAPEINEVARSQLEAIAEKLRHSAAFALQNASVHEPKGSFGCRLIEHGGMCYYNAWSMLREFLDASSSPPSATPEEL